MPVELNVDFSVRFVGMIHNVQGLQHSEEDEVDLINALDQAQVNPIKGGGGEDDV